MKGDKKWEPVKLWAIVWPSGYMGSETFCMRKLASQEADRAMLETPEDRKRCRIIPVTIVPPGYKIVPISPKSKRGTR